MSNSEKYNVRMLSASEFSRPDLIKIFIENDSIVPNAYNSNIQIAETEDGKIIGIAVMQPQYHAEPIYVDPEYRTNPNIHKNLIDSLFAPFKDIKGLRIWIFSPDNKIAKLAMRFGFKYKDYEVFVREF